MAENDTDNLNPINDTNPDPVSLDASGSTASTRAGGETGAEEPSTGARGGFAFKDSANRLTQQATDRARAYAGDGKTMATDALDEFSKLMTDAAGSVDERLGEQYGKYARSAAEAISNFSGAIKAKEVDDLIDDARGFVKSSPAIAIGTAAAVGFAIARLIKAGFDAAKEDGEQNA